MENSRLHIFWGYNVCLLVYFSEIYFFPIEGKTLLTQHDGGVDVCITLNGFLHINIHRKMSLISTHTYEDEVLFCIISRRNVFILWKWFWPGGGEKKQVWYVESIFGWWRGLEWSRYSSRILTSGARDIHHISFSYFLWKSLIFLSVFGFLFGKMHSMLIEVCFCVVGWIMKMVWIKIEMVWN